MSDVRPPSLPISGISVGPRGLRLVFAWSRVRFALIASMFFGLLLSITSIVTVWMITGRVLIVAFAALTVFGLFEQWPKRLPRWLDRWILQLLGVVLVVVPAALVACLLLKADSTGAFFHDADRLTGFVMLTFVGILFAPWLALGSMIRQRDIVVRDQAESFALARSELERQALDARLRLLQAQIEPHFLFNTLANVQALVDVRSPQASNVLRSLVAYLRAAIPRLQAPEPTIERELQLVRAYLELMHMRIPDRLRYVIDADDLALLQRCPPATLLTLVENAVRHGIDPSEDGGEVSVEVRVRDGRCQAIVRDTGVGLCGGTEGSGTGLLALRQRLQLYFEGDARLDVREAELGGVHAEVEFPTLQALP
jgi:hypothetical protein